MPRKTSGYALETFLRQLARTGNFALAADLAGLAKSGLYKRKARDPDFAEACETALATFRSNLPSRLREGQGEGLSCLTAHPVLSGSGGLLTKGGDLVLTRGQRRPAQIRRSPAGRLTQAGIDAFLRTLAQTANIRLAANSVGVAHSSIYRRRGADPAFAEAMGEALMTGYDRIETALFESARRAFEPDPEHEAWLEANGGAPLEPLTWDQAFTLYTLHRRQARDGWHGFRKPEGRIASPEEAERWMRRALRRFGVDAKGI